MADEPTDEQLDAEIALTINRMNAELAPVMMGIINKYTARKNLHPKDVITALNTSLMGIAIAHCKALVLTDKATFMTDVSGLWDAVEVAPSIVDKLNQKKGPN